MQTRMAGALGIAGLAALAIALAASPVGLGSDFTLELVSISEIGRVAEGPSLMPAVSANGRYVAFASDASNVVPQDSNARDVFVRDRLLPGSFMVSVASDGRQANAPASFPAISPDGRYVAFQSDADNLAPNDTNDASDVFLHDRLTGATERVSVLPGKDGAQGNGDSLTPSVSGDGRYVTFTSLASNLAPGDTNGDRDVFVRDRLTGVTELASVASDGTQGNFGSGGLGPGPARISSDGRFVVFGSFASNLVPGDTNGFDDIFARDRLAGTTERVSVTSDGTEGNGHSMYGSISDDGRYVVFTSLASNLAPGDTNSASDIFSWDRQTGALVPLSVAAGGQQGNGSSRFPVISADGRLVAYQSDASNLVPGDTNSIADIFLYRMQDGALERVSVATGGGEANAASSSAAVSADGSVVAFQSDATNLVVDDTNDASDIFVWGKPLAPPATPARTPTPTRTPTATPSPTPAARPGDADCDGNVTSIDAALVLQYGAGLLSALRCQGAADVNGDGRVNALDAALILQFVAGLLDRLPP